MRIRSLSNFAECRGTRPVTMRFLHPSSRGRTLARGFCSQLLPRCFTPRVHLPAVCFARARGAETSSLSPLLLRLLLGELEAALAFFLFCFVLRERETEWELGRGRERGGDTESKAGSRLPAVSTEPSSGLEPTNPEILT